MDSQDKHSPEVSSPSFQSERLTSMDLNQRLALLVSFQTNPWYEHFIKTLYQAQRVCMTDVLERRLDGYHDVLNREQVIGEIRGLQRMNTEFNDQLEAHQEQVRDEAEKQQDKK